MSNFGTTRTPAQLAAVAAGNIFDLPSATQMFADILNNAAGVYPAQAYTALSNAAGVTLSVANVPPGLVGTTILRSGAAAVSDTTDTAQNIVTSWPGAMVGMTGTMTIANTNSGTLTLVAGTNVTLAGTTTIATNTTRFYQWKVTNTCTPQVSGAAPTNATATNTTTTTAAVAAQTNASSVVIPVTATTGMIANASYLQWTDLKGVVQYGLITSIVSLNVTVANAGTNGIASGASIGVFNNTLTLTGMWAVATATA